MTGLVVHIGHGRTGSSSIQRTMIESLDELEAQRLFFLGLMLERVDVPDAPAWLHQYGSPEFFALPPAQAAEELYAVLAAGVEQAERAGASAAVWSNEWVLQREAFVRPALARLRDEGVDVTVLCYVRRHDAWARSAYIQWGIKDKGYHGVVRPYAAWAQGFGEENFSFAPFLEPWADEFGTAFRLFNFDAIDDVVAHFLGEVGAVGIPTYDANASAMPEVLAANAVFNSMSLDPIVAERFQFHHQRAGDPVRVPELEQLVPTPAQLEELVAAHTDDIAVVDALLAERGQPALDFGTPLVPVPNPTLEQTDGYLMQVVFYLAEEVRQLKQELQGQQALVDRLRQRVNRRPDQKK